MRNACASDHIGSNEGNYRKFIICRSYRKGDRIVMKEIAFFESTRVAHRFRSSRADRGTDSSRREQDRSIVSLSVVANRIRRSNRHARTRTSLEHGKVLRCVFASSNARQSRDRERARSYAVVFFHSLSLSVFLSPRSPRHDQDRGMRRRRFISTPVAIVPFVS
jgi:hypothetical protein